MSLKSAGGYCQARAEAERDILRQRAVICDGAVRQLSSAISILLYGKGEFLTLKKLYPELFSEKSTAKLSQEERDIATISAWRAFLGI